VNVPAFRLDVVDQGKPVLGMRVIVGAEYNDRATPVFSDSISTWCSSDWNVPDEIAPRDLGGAQSPGDAATSRGAASRSSTDGGKQHSGSGPGGKNSPRSREFIFPNDFSIYCTTRRREELFQKDVRAVQSTVIRLEHPLELAETVLDWPEDRVRER